jgi:hypothetical protein
MNLVVQHGGPPFIAFRVNANPKEDDTYANMVHYYDFNREDFLAHYHKRSNVETTFSMIKAKFGDSLRSRSDAAIVNEVLCKLLCHNVCVLIQSDYELGIATEFLGKSEMTEEILSEVLSVEEATGVWPWI